MIQADGPDNSKHGLQSQKDAEIPMIYAPRTWPAVVAIVGLTAVGGGGIALLWNLSKAITDVAAADNFVAQNGLSLFIFLAVIAQALIYFSQRNLMHKQWEAMNAQLEAIEDQARSTREGLVETRKLVAQNESMAAQNERAAVAAEESAKTAREAFHVGEAPYFGITRLLFAEFLDGCRLRLAIAFLNGGKTPAWHFHATPELIFGDNPHDGERFKCEIELAELVSTFIPSGAERTIEYQSKFELTTERLTKIMREDAKLFVIVKARYMDIRKVWHPRTFRCVWSPSGKFRDFDAIDLTTPSDETDDSDKQKAN
jgi:hypothetical protein